MRRIYLLSPASSSGKRAGFLFNPGATFALAEAIRARGVPLGEVFAFLSGLYFRGKLAYARHFAVPPTELPGVYVITPSRGLMLPDQEIDLEVLREFAGVPVDPHDARYREPLRRDLVQLRERIGPDCDVVLLGSIATDKYVALIQEQFGEKLRFPAEFVGRGDMSRGGLLLRCVDANTPLTYIAVEGALRRGTRPPRLEPRTT